MKKQKLSKEILQARKLSVSNLFDLSQIVKSTRDKRDAELDRIRKSIDRLKKRQERLYNNTPTIKDYLEALGETLRKKLKADFYEVYGPFGLSNEYGLSVCLKTEDDKKEKTLLHMSCCPGHDDGIVFIDDNTDTGNYPKGSIGKLNGLHKKRLSPTNKMTLNWIIKNCSYQEQE